MLIPDDITLSYKEQQDITFGIFFEQWLFWFSLQMEFEWPGGKFYSLKTLHGFIFFPGEMITLNYKELTDFSFREFVVQFLPFLVGRNFSVSSLDYVETDAGTMIRMSNLIY